MNALEALSRLSRVGAVSDDELAAAKARLLAWRAASDVRPVGPGRRARTLAVALDTVRAASGEPLPGAVAWLEKAAERFQVAVVIASDTRDGEDVAHRAWMRHAGLSDHALTRVRFAALKPPAEVYIDARGLRFEGVFPDAGSLSGIMARRQ